MNQETCHALNQINRRFYESVADEFDQTRQAAWQGWQQLRPMLQQTLRETTPRILDLGCGNGRFARFLADFAQQPAFYLGVDANHHLLEQAKSGIPTAQYHWLRWDLLEHPLPPPRPQKRFNLIVVFGLLHHIPGAEQRHRLLYQLTQQLALGGRLVITFWQFDRSKRILSRVIPWQDYQEQHAPSLDLKQLEFGDYLLPFGSSSKPRYCHLTTAEERDKLLKSLPLREIGQFEADGADGTLNHYWVGEAAAGPAADGNHSA